MAPSLKKFAEEHFQKGGSFVPARVQAALALTERLRDQPSLLLDDHLSGGASLESHETYGRRVHERLGLAAVNKNYGRRSSNVQSWGQPLLNELRAAGFETATIAKREQLLNSVQQELAACMHDMLARDPLRVKVQSRSIESIVREVLKQAEERGKQGDVAQYLVGAKLALRFNRDIPVLPANKGDRRHLHDLRQRRGDFELENAVIEVAMGLPDEPHLSKIAAALDDSDLEVWVLTRSDRVATWQSEIALRGDIDCKRVVIASVEAFIGQNVTELAVFSSAAKLQQFEKLVEIYNSRWIAKLEQPGLRIELR